MCYTAEPALCVDAMGGAEQIGLQRITAKNPTPQDLSTFVTHKSVQSEAWVIKIILDVDKYHFTDVL